MAAEELTATIASELRRFENPGRDVAIFTGHAEAGDVVVKGVVDEQGPLVGGCYRFYGKWTTYHNRYSGQDQQQFAYTSYCPATPAGERGMVRYLQSAPGIGPTLAGRLWLAYDTDAVRVLREEPGRAAREVLRMTPEIAAEASAWLVKRAALEACTMDLMELLDGHGFGKSITSKVLKAWGNRAAELVRRSPYLLMRFRGVGFKKCDAMYLRLGKNPAALKRQALCAWYAIASAASGDTWHRAEICDAMIRQSIGSAQPDTALAMRLAARAKAIAVHYVDHPNGGEATQWVAEYAKASTEWTLARLAAMAMRDDPPVGNRSMARQQADAFVPLSKHQREQMRLAMRGCLGILGGSPGTGKTFTAAAIVKAAIAAFGSNSVAVCAPTGKAAVRMGEVMCAANIPMAASTIHSLLGVQTRGDDGWGFVHGTGLPLRKRLIVVDEASMIDADLMRSLLAARGRGCRVLLIGDVNQLPPVGHGAPLRDFIKAGVPYGELTEVRRNAGAIVEACAAMRDGKPFFASITHDPEACNLTAIQAPEGEGQLSATLTILSDLRRRGFDPMWHCQVVVPLNESGKVSRAFFNNKLQAALNAAPNPTKHRFLVGDKVVNGKNGLFIAAGASEETSPVDGKYYVANGEIGRVTEVTPTFMVVALESPQRQVRAYTAKAEGEADASSWDLAYAISCHKSQGSEWPVVIVIIDESRGAARLCDRSWIYTAISRAKRECILVGRLSTAHSFARTTNIDARKTFLVETMQEINHARRTLYLESHPAKEEGIALAQAD